MAQQFTDVNWRLRINVFTKIGEKIELKDMETCQQKKFVIKLLRAVGGCLGIDRR